MSERARSSDGRAVSDARGWSGVQPRGERHFKFAPPDVTAIAERHGTWLSRMPISKLGGRRSRCHRHRPQSRILSHVAKSAGTHGKGKPPFSKRTPPMRLVRCCATSWRAYPRPT